MKQIIFILCLLYVTNVYAQKKVEVMRKTGDIMLNGVKYGNAQEHGNVFSRDAMTIRDNQGKDLIYVRYHREDMQLFYEITFVATKQVAYKSRGRMNTKRDIANFLIEYGALTQGGINAVGEEKILILFKDKPPYNYNNSRNYRNMNQ